MLRRHVGIAVVFAALPLGARLAGVGPTFTMYASSVEFRVELLGRAQDGTTKPIPPSSLALALPPSARSFAAGADRFRRVGEVTVLRRHLDDLARLACHQDGSLDEVEIALDERDIAGAKQTRVRCRCSK